MTQQNPYRPSILKVPARTPQEAVEKIANGGAREAGRYDWVKISCGNQTIERPPHRGGQRTV